MCGDELISDSVASSKGVGWFTEGKHIRDVMAVARTPERGGR
jgi:hypothetical protein